MAEAGGGRTFKRSSSVAGDCTTASLQRASRVVHLKAAAYWLHILAGVLVANLCQPEKGFGGVVGCIRVAPRGTADSRPRLGRVGWHGCGGLADCGADSFTVPHGQGSVSWAAWISRPKLR